MSAGLTLTELIDTEILRQGNAYFRNRDICEATGASRQHVSQHLQVLYKDGILEKHGVQWYLNDAALMTIRLLKQSRTREMRGSRLLVMEPEKLERAVEAITLLKGQRSEWEAYAYRIEDILKEEVDTALETLRTFKSMLNKPPKSRQGIFAHVGRNAKYAVALQKTFYGMMINFLALNKDDESEDIIVEHIRPEAERWLETSNT